MNVRKCRVTTAAGLLMSSMVLFSPEKILGDNSLVVEKSTPLAVTLDGTTAQSHDRRTYDQVVAHGDISLRRINTDVEVLAITTADLSLGPEDGDAPKVTLYNESYNDERCRLTADAIEVGSDGGWGSFDVEGGRLQTKNLSVCANAAVPEGAVLLTLSSGKNVPGKLYLNKLFNHANASVALRFNGGVLRPNYKSNTELFHPVAGDIILSSAGDNPIKIVNENGYVNFFLKSGSATYAGKIKTEGEGDFIIDGKFDQNGKIALADEVILILHENVRGDVVWGHKGDFVLKHHSVMFNAANIAPANADTGMIRLSCEDPEHPAVFNMNKYGQTVNGIAVAPGEYGKVTAAKETVLTVGLYKDGELTNVDFGNEVKIVQEGNTIEFACKSVSGYQVKAGTLKIMRSAEMGTLELAAGVTVDIAEGAVLKIGTLKDDGAVFTGKGGFGIDEGGAYLNKTYGLKTVKSGPGTFVYNQKAPLGDVDVLEGTLKLAGTGSTNEWWRVTIDDAPWRLNIAAIGLFSGSTFDSVLDGYTYSQAESADSIGKGQIYYDTLKYSGQNGYFKSSANEFTVSFTKDASVLLDSDPATGMSIIETHPDGLAFTFRRAEADTVPVTSFSLRYPINAEGATQTYEQRSADKYHIEMSADGSDWKEVGRVEGRGTGTWGSWTDNRPFPMTLPPGVPVSGGLGLADGAAVRVASGATLDLLDSAGNNLVSKLVVDAHGDNGTILGAALAAEGVIVVRNFTTQEAIKNIKLLSLPGITASLSGWRVQDESGNALLIAFAVRNGEMAVANRGLVMSVR